MLALILAGGSGSRLDLGEKPLVTIRGEPMVGHVIRAFLSGGYEPVVILSDRTPFTRNWCRAHNIEYLVASGTGYVPDIAEAVSVLDEEGSFFTCVADLPCITPRIIGEVEDRYRKSGKEACSVWVPQSIGGRDIYADEVEGVMACPAGLNILRGDAIDRPQEELRLLIRDRRLAFNINTREELAAVKSLLGDH
ncbi:MAG: NTP transferase domain-containing protein [Methanoregulaceae archaeon]|jgi:adenosylcobinamide-phosphate guanylyltransferase|nr:NTP transferase domain-containing protein [Methanoregulaceae archaeon]